ncbi:HNH endonuclease [compost metagenome]
MYKCEYCNREFNTAGNLSNHLKHKHKIKMTKLEDILVINSTYKNTNRLKDWIVREGLLKYECQECGISPEWNGKPLRLQLDHINGVNNDNRLENLRILCPNCHTQTENYSARNIKKK